MQYAQNWLEAQGKDMEWETEGNFSNKELKQPLPRTPPQSPPSHVPIEKEEKESAMWIHRRAREMTKGTTSTDKDIRRRGGEEEYEPGEDEEEDEEEKEEGEYPDGRKRMVVDSEDRERERRLHRQSKRDKEKALRDDR